MPADEACAVNLDSQYPDSDCQREPFVYVLRIAYADGPSSQPKHAARSGGSNPLVPSD